MTHAELIKFNEKYYAPMDYPIQPNEKDYSRIKKAIAKIESSRTNHPIAGDLVEYTDKNGTYYPNGIVEKSEKNKIILCGGPTTPFYYNEYTYSISGGPFSTSMLNDYEFIGKAENVFQIWGDHGACGNGAIRFKCIVNKWRYTEKEQKFPGFSTKEYDREYIGISYIPKGYTYIHRGEHIAFENEKELWIWMKTYHAVSFPGYWPCQRVYWYYRPIKKLISKSDYDILNLPEDTRLCNGTIKIKFLTDHLHHSITEYRYTNDGSNCNDLPYMAARQEMNL